MGLSRTPINKGDISTFQVLLEVAESLKTLISDPKALEKAAKDSFALSDAEEAKAAEAKALIAQSEAAQAEAKKQQGILDDKMVEYAKIKASIDGTMDSIRKEQARLAAVDSALGARGLELDGLKSDLQLRESQLAQGIRKLAADNIALEKRAETVIADEAALKEKAAKLRGLMDA